MKYKNQMKLEIMQSVTDMAANAFIRWINEPGPTQRASSPEELAAARAKQEREAAEWRGASVALEPTHPPVSGEWHPGSSGLLSRIESNTARAIQK